MEEEFIEEEAPYEEEQKEEEVDAEELDSSEEGFIKGYEDESTKTKKPAEDKDEELTD